MITTIAALETEKRRTFQNWNVAPFSELILSWNGIRPKQGYWAFSISLFQNQWSPWLPYVEWGAGIQKSFACNPDDSFAKTYQDVALSKSGLCTAYRVLIEAHDGADLKGLRSLHMCCTDAHTFQSNLPLSLPKVELPSVFGHSQMALSHPRHRDLCSPTSTTAAINFLLQKRLVDPIEFAGRSRDQGFDIFGNWILNTAAAYESLGEKYHIYVTRHFSFAQVLEKIGLGLPVVLSVKGPLPGAPLPYAYGHLLMAIGYDPETKTVACMDPSFQTDAETIVKYRLEDLLEAWSRRRNLAYIFDQNIPI